MVQHFSLTTEMIYCIYLKLFEWMNNVMFIVGYLDIECIYIYICIHVLPKSFPPLSPLWLLPKYPNSSHPCKKTKERKVATENGAPWASQQTMSNWKEPGTESMPTTTFWWHTFRSSYNPPLFAGKGELVRRRFLGNIWDLLKSFSNWI